MSHLFGSEVAEPQVFTAKDLNTDQDIRWCPGCGDYSILKQMQTVLPSFGVEKHKIVFVSGIGCSSRFPYYMNTYGMHSIHGRATAIASGLKISRPDLHVWVITGDGDALSIGGNHTIHLLRRNIDLNVLLFNNEIYGLTKGQYSPTSHEGQVTKSTPYGSLDHPFNPLALFLGADATFIARSMDRDTKHLQGILKEGARHKGTSMIEVYQNCNVFNDGAFEVFTDKESKPLSTLFVEHGKPLVYGLDNSLGIALQDGKPSIINLNESNLGTSDLWVHDKEDLYKADVLVRFFENEVNEFNFPRPFGVLYQTKRGTYEDALSTQMDLAKSKTHDFSLDTLIRGPQVWEVI